MFLGDQLTVYGYADTPALSYCLAHDVTFVDIATGDVYGKSYETTQNGVKYYISSYRYAYVSGLAVGRPADPVIPDTVDGAPVTELC